MYSLFVVAKLSKKFIMSMVPDDFLSKKYVLFMLQIWEKSYTFTLDLRRVEWVAQQMYF